MIAEKRAQKLKAKWVFWDLAAANAMTGVYAFGGVSEEDRVEAGAVSAHRAHGPDRGGLCHAAARSGDRSS